MKKLPSLPSLALALVATGPLAAADKPAAPIATAIYVAGAWNVTVETSASAGKRQAK